MILRLQPVRVDTASDDTEGLLIFAENALVAVLVCLSDAHDENAGKWFFEAGFGRIHHSRPPVFSDLDDAQAWIGAALAADVRR